MEDERPGGRGLAVLLAVSALFAGAIGARTSLFASNASGPWQQAVRHEVKAAAAAVGDIRFVYGDEASQAFRAVEASVRTLGSRRAARLTIRPPTSGGADDAPDRFPDRD